eukprot:ANDGO_03527.mRNA.1 hypothetical protein
MERFGRSRSPGDDFNIEPWSDDTAADQDLADRPQAVILLSKMASVEIFNRCSSPVPQPMSRRPLPGKIDDHAFEKLGKDENRWQERGGSSVESRQNRDPVPLGNLSLSSVMKHRKHLSLNVESNTAPSSLLVSEDSEVPAAPLADAATMGSRPREVPASLSSFPSAGGLSESFVDGKQFVDISSSGSDHHRQALPMSLSCSSSPMSLFAEKSLQKRSLDVSQSGAALSIEQSTIQQRSATVDKVPLSCSRSAKLDHSSHTPSPKTRESGDAIPSPKAVLREATLEPPPASPGSTPGKPLSPFKFSMQNHQRMRSRSMGMPLNARFRNPDLQPNRASEQGVESTPNPTGASKSSLSSPTNVVRVISTSSSGGAGGVGSNGGVLVGGQVVAEPAAAVDSDRNRIDFESLTVQDRIDSTSVMAHTLRPPHQTIASAHVRGVGSIVSTLDHEDMVNRMFGTTYSAGVLSKNEKKQKNEHNAVPGRVAILSSSAFPLSESHSDHFCSAASETASTCSFQGPRRRHNSDARAITGVGTRQKVGKFASQRSATPNSALFPTLAPIKSKSQESFYSAQFMPSQDPADWEKDLDALPYDADIDQYGEDEMELLSSGLWKKPSDPTKDSKTARGANELSQTRTYVGHTKDSSGSKLEWDPFNSFASGRSAGSFRVPSASDRFRQRQLVADNSFKVPPKRTLVGGPVVLQRGRSSTSLGFHSEKGQQLAIDGVHKMSSRWPAVNSKRREAGAQSNNSRNTVYNNLEDEE